MPGAVRIDQEPFAPQIGPQKADSRWRYDLMAVDDLESVPLEWVSRLHQVAMSAKSKESLRMIEQIRPQYPAVADALTELVNTFRFDTIMSLTEEVISQ